MCFADFVSSGYLGFSGSFMLRRDFLAISSAIAAGSGRLRAAGIPVSPANSVLDYGAVGDGKTVDTDALQRAITVCANRGGGTVLLPGGHTFVSGTLQLRSHIDFAQSHGEIGSILRWPRLKW